MDKSVARHWHQLSESEVLELVETDLQRGLDPLAVEDRQKRFGLNKITQKQGSGSFTRFLLQFHQPLVYILLVAAVITAWLHEWVDSSVIFAVVLLNAVIGFVQETKALKAIDALARAMVSTATVLRSGQRRPISASQLVPGDVVLLQSGDKVPADLRLMDCRELQTDESTLTGESIPVQKRTETVERDAVLADRRNMVYSSTLVSCGTATGVVVGTGDRTEIGRISQLISSAEVLATPLTRKISEFSGIMLYVILGMAVATFAVGILRGQPALQMFMAAVALAVGAIPEGLPAAVTITLAIGVSKMAKRNAIIRKLPAVETLGSTTVICSDKTGTLTQNQMTVRALYVGSDRFALTGVGYTPEGQFSCQGKTIVADQHPLLAECLKAGMLCNDSALVQTADTWQAEGDPTEAALIVSARKGGIDPETIARQFPRLDTIPFESQHQYMATLHTVVNDTAPSDGAATPVVVCYLKGSVESILPRCEKVFGATESLAASDVRAVHGYVDEMAATGLRVLAFARIDFPAGTTTIEHSDLVAGLSFVGLQGMIDPPRPGATCAINACRTAGIQVKMITGDHAGTAAAIAAQIGLGGPPPAADCGLLSGDHVLTGKRLSELSDQQLLDAVQRTTVFARVAPEQKLRLVKALQHMGHVVAMTGDGVNDAPALRQANIGVAMGITGTEVAKEAADMVLTDDNFSTIKAAIEEGRGVFDNLVKFIIWTMPTSIAEGLIIMLAVFAGTMLPILPVQALWINMTTAVLLGLTLAFESKEPGIMHRPSRDPASPLLDRTLVVRILIVSAMLIVSSFGLLTWELSRGETEAVARTVVVNVIVFGEMFYLFNCRSLTRSMFAIGVFSNRWLLIGVGLMAVLQLAFTYLPIMNQAFGSAAIGANQWFLILASSTLIYCGVGLEKYWRAVKPSVGSSVAGRPSFPSSIQPNPAIKDPAGDPSVESR